MKEKEGLIKVGNYNSKFNEILGTDEDYLYVSTMHDVQESKISRPLHSGRIKVFSVDSEEKQ